MAGTGTLAASGTANYTLLFTNATSTRSFVTWSASPLQATSDVTIYGICLKSEGQAGSLELWSLTGSDGSNFGTLLASGPGAWDAANQLTYLDLPNGVALSSGKWYTIAVQTQGIYFYCTTSGSPTGGLSVKTVNGTNNYASPDAPRAGSLSANSQSWEIAMGMRFTAPVVAITGNADVSGNGTLTAASSTVSGTTTLDGIGTLSAHSNTVSGAGTLAGDGTLSASSSSAAGSGALEGDGTLTAWSSQVNGQAELTGGGSLRAVSPDRAGAAGLAGDGALQAAGSARLFATAMLTSVGRLWIPGGVRNITVSGAVRQPWSAAMWVKRSDL